METLPRQHMTCFRPSVSATSAMFQAYSAAERSSNPPASSPPPCRSQRRTQQRTAPSLCTPVPLSTPQHWMHQRRAARRTWTTPYQRNVLKIQCSTVQCTVVLKCTLCISTVLKCTLLSSSAREFLRTYIRRSCVLSLRSAASDDQQRRRARSLGSRGRKETPAGHPASPVKQQLLRWSERSGKIALEVERRCWRSQGSRPRITPETLEGSTRDAHSTECVYLQCGLSDSGIDILGIHNFFVHHFLATVHLRLEMGLQHKTYLFKNTSFNLQLRFLTTT